MNNPVFQWFLEEVPEQESDHLFARVSMKKRVTETLPDDPFVIQVS
jgi:hypothetical protein